MTSTCSLSLSIVSHGQGALIKNLLVDSRSFRGPSFEILLTLNIPEDKSFLDGFSDLPITVIENASPKGFGDNHNAAFRHSRGQAFAIVNPDIRAQGLDLTPLYKAAMHPSVGACAPRVTRPDGATEDSFRKFPTLSRLLRRVLLRQRQADYHLQSHGLTQVDWVAGMFVVFPRAAYEAVGGFDTRYFMYMEDADICRRLSQRDLRILVDGATAVVHEAQRASHRSLKHLAWHTRSAVRYMTGY